MIRTIGIQSVANMVGFCLLGVGSIAAHSQVLGAHVLDETQLDTITAGTASPTGGTAAINGATVDIMNSGSITLGENAGQEAQGLNLGNAADSVVSNALNVWNGELSDTSVTTTLNVEQSNLTMQDGAHSATASDYTRGQSEALTSSLSTTSSSEGMSTLVTTTSVDTQQTLGGGGLALGGSSGGSTDEGTGSSGTGGSSLGVPEVAAQVGKGVALGGTVEFSVDAAVISVGVEAGASMSNTTRNTTRVQGPDRVTGDGRVFQNEFVNDFGMEGNVSLDYELSTPPISLDVAGSGCFVMVGGCEADANETGEWLDTATSTEVSTSNQDGALSVDTVSAEYLVLDQSNMSLESNYSIVLSGNAQQAAQALNLLNAAGSVVNNAVNVSRTPSAGPTTNLVQSNVVQQRW